MRTHFIAMAFATGVLLGTMASAAEPIIGYVKTTRGNAFIESADGSSRARPGSAVRKADTLRTADGGSIGVTLRDNSRISLGSESTLELTGFTFEPAREEYSFLARMARGTLLYVSGLIAKLKPESAQVRTASATIGIRGTRFLLKVEGDE